jgi:hypothetical protein
VRLSSLPLGLRGSVVTKPSDFSDRDAIEREVGARLSWERSGNRVYISALHVARSDAVP